MALNYSTLGMPANKQVVDPTTGKMREEWALYFDQLTTRLNGAVGELVADVAPADAEFIVGAASSGLSAERVVTNTSTVTWDLTTPAQAKANVPTGVVDAGMLDGFDTSASGNRWGVIPVVGTDGVMEIGRYIDFHNSDADTGDTANRLQTGGGVVGLFEHPNNGAAKRIVSLTDSTLAQGDVIYYDGTNFVRLAPGTSGQFLKTNGAAANPAWVTQTVMPIAQGAISSAATLDIALGSADMYEIDFMQMAPATDNVTPFLRFSQSGSYLSGASDYMWQNFRRTPAGGSSFTEEDLSDSEMNISGSVGNASGEYITCKLRIYRPSASSFYKEFLCEFIYFDNAGSPRSGISHGRLIANTNAIDGVRFLFSSGNIASGYYAARSYSFS